MKVRQILDAYTVLRNARIGKISSDSDKMSIIMNTRNLKKVADEFEEFKSITIEQMKGKSHDDMVEKYQQIFEEKQQGKTLSLPEDEVGKVLKYVSKYDSQVKKCIAEEGKKDKEIQCITISGESFNQLIGCNDFSAEEYASLMSILCE